MRRKKKRTERRSAVADIVLQKPPPHSMAVALGESLIFDSTALPTIRPPMVFARALELERHPFIHVPSRVSGTELTQSLPPIFHYQILRDRYPAFEAAVRSDMQVCSTPMVDSSTCTLPLPSLSASQVAATTTRRSTPLPKRFKLSLTISAPSPSILSEISRVLLTSVTLGPNPLYFVQYQSLLSSFAKSV